MSGPVCSEPVFTKVHQVAAEDPGWGRSSGWGSLARGYWWSLLAWSSQVCFSLWLMCDADISGNRLEVLASLYWLYHLKFCK